MRLTLKGLVAAFAVAALVETAVFAIHYQDLLYLRSPVDRIAVSGADTFAHHAATALEREKVPVDRLETIAAAARELGLAEIELRALRRRATEDPADTDLRLRLADALRRSEQYGEAERVYLALLESKEGGR